MCDERHSEWKIFGSGAEWIEGTIPEEELKKNEKNETYIPVESLESRLNSVIGVLNYDTLVTYEGIQEVLGRFVVVAKTILIIYDDERNAWSEVCAWRQ